MAKKSKKTEVQNMDIKALAWKRFYETGEIGAYMLYKKLSEEEDGATDNAGDCTPSD
ncbi:MAG: YqzL family protein [Clostridia bacterium]|nr:YqzL family protein [Clostridia bacterium]